MQDILFDFQEGIFSFRTAGILICNEKILLQKPDGDDTYAFPGGHVSFGETSSAAVIRELKEETGIDAETGRLRWICESFFGWNKKKCQQIGLYYDIHLKNNKPCIPDSFDSIEVLPVIKSTVKFYWVPVRDLYSIKLYPSRAAFLLNNNSNGIEHFTEHE